MNQKYGIIAAFDTVPEVYHACEQVRDAGYSRWDTLTSFPIHGLDYAMGMPRERSIPASRGRRSACLL